MEPKQIVHRLLILSIWFIKGAVCDDQDQGKCLYKIKLSQHNFVNKSVFKGDIFSAIAFNGTEIGSF